MWTVSRDEEIKRNTTLQSQRKVDIVLALDDTSFVEAGESVKQNNLYGAIVYGIGNSTEAVYYLDARWAECLIVPDEFTAGYQCVAETVNQVSGNIKNQSEDSMKIKITGIIIMVIFAGTLIFYTCGKSQPQTDNQIYIGVACYDQKDTFIEELVDAFKEQCSSMESKDYAISMTIMDASN